MTNEELKKFLTKHPDYKICPDCGGAGERIFPGGKSVECVTCQGAGVVKKPALTWTTTPPTMPGAYWWRDGGRQFIRNVWGYDDDLLKDFGGEWYGPIPQPKE